MPEVEEDKVRLWRLPIIDRNYEGSFVGCNALTPLVSRGPSKVLREQSSQRSELPLRWKMCWLAQHITKSNSASESCSGRIFTN